jgi:hypothetical protein
MPKEYGAQVSTGHLEFPLVLCGRVELGQVSTEAPTSVIRAQGGAAGLT